MKNEERKIDELLKENEAERLAYFMPCWAFRGGDCGDQLEKIEEEFHEVWKATAEYVAEPSGETREAFLMECADVQVAIETLMMQLGADESERWEARRKVWEKNNARGYYDEKR